MLGREANKRTNTQTTTTKKKRWCQLPRFLLPSRKHRTQAILDYHDTKEERERAVNRWKKERGKKKSVGTKK